MPADSKSLNLRVCFFGYDPSLRAALETRASAEGISLLSVQTFAGLMYAAGSQAVPVLILQTDCLAPGRSIATVLERLAEATGTRPRLIALAPQRARAAAACREAHATFQAPFDGDLVWARVIQALPGKNARQQFVMVVDSLPEERDEIVAALRPAGLLVESVTEPRLVMSALERAPVDLLLLDLNLPQDASRALTATIRSHETLVDLPIIFISAQAAPDYQGEVLRLGGDEYIARPLVPERLLAAVQARLARVPPPVGGGAAAPGAGPRTPPLLSRNQLLRRLDHAILDHRVAPTGQAVLFIRIDNAPALSTLDAAGLDMVRSLILDLVLANAALVLRAVCQSDDGVYAWVRDESSAQIVALGELIRAGAARLALPPGLKRLTLSIGVSPFTPQVDNALTLISRAQAAGEQARRAGGDRVALLESAPRAGADGGPDQDPILHLLRGALVGSGFQLVYQPILSLRKSQRARYEVLLRLRTFHGEIMPPATFLPVAEQYGLLPDLDRWVLTRALETLRLERDAGRPTMLVIFQSGASLTAPGWLDWVRAEVLRLDLIRQRPVLEFGVQDILGNEDHARVLFPALGRLGIEVCLGAVTDDEEVLGLIARRPIRTAKLARELVARADSAHLKSLVEALHGRSARVIGAGIEDPETIGRVWSSGADFIQGNFIQFPEETLNFQFQEGVII